MTYLNISPQRSFIFLAALILVMLGAIACIMEVVGLPVLRVSIMLLAMIYFVFLLNRYYLLADHQSIQQLCYDGSQHWRVKLRDGWLEHLELDSASLVTRYFILLLFKVPGKRKRYSLLLFPDSENKENLRLLRARLMIL